MISSHKIDINMPDLAQCWFPSAVLDIKEKVGNTNATLHWPDLRDGINCCIKTFSPFQVTLTVKIQSILQSYSWGILEAASGLNCLVTSKHKNPTTHRHGWNKTLIWMCQYKCRSNNGGTDFCLFIACVPIPYWCFHFYFHTSQEQNCK